MIKYFCDVCGIEVDNPAVSLDMTGKVLCGEHFRKHEENKINVWNKKSTKNNWKIKLDFPASHEFIKYDEK